MLLKEFSTIFDRPEKVKKLREYILSLSVRGKLVEQDENDEPISSIIDTINIDKEELLSKRKVKLKKVKEIEDIKNMLYELPDKWEWMSFKDVVFFQEGPGIRSWQFRDNGIKLINVQNIVGNELVLDNTSKYVEIEEFMDKYQHFEIEEDDLLFASSGGSWGKSAWFKNPGYKVMLNTSMIRMKFFSGKLNSNYLKYFIDSTIFKKQMEIQLVGMQPNFGSTHLSRIYIPMPPLNEQNRIVEKLDYLMEFCDKLETELEKKVKYATLSAKSVLNGVSNCSSYEELEEALRFIIENFKDLTLADGAVGELKNAILSLAVKGKLVPQDESDEPASMLLERIREEKDRLVKEKKIKKEKPLPDISDDETYYELPKGWEWVRLNDISSYIQRGKSPKYCESSNIPVISQKCIQWNGFDIDKARFIEVDSLEKYGEERYIRPNDLLWNSTGKGTLGRINIYPENIEFDIAVADSHVTIIRPIEINSKYLYCWFGGPIVQNEIDDKSSGSTKQTELSTTTVKSYLVPIPPLEEQKRIVEKVDKLMKVCDKLELRIEESKKYNEKLMESILKESFKA